MDEIRCRWKAWPGAEGVSMCGRDRAKLPRFSRSIWAEKVVISPRCESNSSPILRIPFTPLTCSLPPGPSLPLFTDMSPPTPGRQAFVVADEPHVKPTQITLGFGLQALAPHFVFIKVGRKERWERGGTRRKQRITHRGHFTPVKRSRCFPCCIFRVWSS